MCGRMSLFVPPSVLESRFDATVATQITPRYNIAPGDDLVVVRNDTPNEIDLATWGFVPAWVDDLDGWPTPINARAESIAETSSFEEAFRSRRCLVLADGFYEWRGDRGGKQPYRITRKDDEPFAFAGIWDRRDGCEGRETVAIVTTDANDVVAPIHDRMPVILEAEAEDVWLHAADPAARHEALDPVAGSSLRAYPVSSRVNDPGVDTADVIEPIDVDEQSGLTEFG